MYRVSPLQRNAAGGGAEEKGPERSAIYNKSQFLLLLIPDLLLLSLQFLKLAFSLVDSSSAQLLALFFFNNPD